MALYFYCMLLMLLVVLSILLLISYCITITADIYFLLLSMILTYIYI